ncbi:MAG: DUF4012 domain-containing protein [Anaerolineae bacterium]
MNPRRRIGWLILALGTVLLFLWGARVIRAGLSLRRHLAQAEALLRSPETANPETACALVGSLRQDLGTVRREAGLLVSLAPALGWLPRVGGDLRAAPHLLVMADGLTEAGAVACDLLGPALAGDSLSLDGAIRLLTEEQSDLKRAQAAVARAEEAWRQVDVSRLSPRMARRVAPLGRMLPALRAGLDVAAAMPDLLGANGPRVYLIIAQNEDELRPTGGYITGVGEVRMENGRIAAMTFRDSYAVDDFTQPYPDPPEPLRRYMGIDLWVFRDSNWSPDFPTAARQAIALYRPGDPVTVDGVIALDQYAVKELVGAVGPLPVEGADEPITGETVISYMRRAWEPEDGALTGEWWRERKSFMGPLAEALWARIQREDVDWLRLAETVVRLLDEKHLLLYIPHPVVAPLLAERGWDGALRAGPADFLLVVDANVGYNKASAKVQQAITYEVDLGRNPPRATLTLVYTHTVPTGSPCVPESRYDPVYEQMMARCYWDYLRVYIPQGSRLLDATRIPVPKEALWSGEAESSEVTVLPADEGPFTTLEVLLLLLPGAVQTRSFTWALPESVVRRQGDEAVYALRVQKQPGTVDRPLTVRIRLDDGDTLLSADPPPSASEGTSVVFQARLDRDREFTVRFRRER